MSLSTTFQSVEHAIASVAGDIVKAGKAVVGVLAKIQASEAVVESVTAFIDPAVVPIERAAYAALGILVKAVHDVGAVQAQGGVNVALDAQTVAELQAILPAIKAGLAASGVSLGGAKPLDGGGPGAVPPR